jgi:hypothetical protein
MVLFRVGTFGNCPATEADTLIIKIILIIITFIEII